MKQLIIKIVLSVVIIILAYLVVDSIRKPVKFNRQKEKREKVVIERLKNIRNAQVVYKSLYGRYTSSWDTLISFLDTARIPIVKIMPDPEDTTFTKTINDTIGYINAADSLFHREFDINDLKKIPYSDNAVFDLDAGTIEKGKVKAKVFEVSAPYDQILHGLDQQMVINLVATRKQLEKFPGLRVGSMEEPSTDGNWEY